MVVPIDGVEGGDKDVSVSVCKFCGEVTQMVYNCNSMQCNAVFVCCQHCAAEMQEWVNILKFKKILKLKILNNFCNSGY